MRRRLFLWGSALSASMLAAPCLSKEALSTLLVSGQSLRLDHARAFLDSVCPSKGSQIRIAQVGCHSTAEQALAQLCSNVSIERMLAFAGYSPELKPKDFCTAFQAQRNDDFRKSNTLLLDGWVVARAELALCSLASHCHLQDRLS